MKYRLFSTVAWNLLGLGISVATLCGVNMELSNQVVLMIVCVATGSIMATMPSDRV